MPTRTPSVERMLEDPAERDRILRHDSKLLIVTTVKVGDEEQTTIKINRDYELDQLARFVNDLPLITSGDRSERASKGVNVAEVAEKVWGSRFTTWVDRVERDLPYYGPVNPKLADGAHCHVDNGTVFRTASLDDIQQFIIGTQTSIVDGATKAVKARIKKGEDFFALCERRNDEAKALTSAARAEAFDELNVQLPLFVKALGSGTAKKK